MIPNLKDFENVPIMWSPTGNTSESERKFRETIENKYQVKIGDYWDFHKWTIENIPEFWEEVWNFTDVKYSKSFDMVIDLNVSMSERPEWFQGARLNFAENLLRYRDDGVALITTGEEKETRQVTYAEVYERSQLYAAAFRKCGLKKGDVVACYMSNREEPIFAMLAAVSIGAIWTGVLPFYGAPAALNRFLRVKPKFLLTVDRFVYNRKENEMLQKVKEISEGLESLEKIIIVSSKEESKLKDISSIKKSCFLEDFLQLGLENDGSVLPFEFEQVSFSHPVFISYTSGTSGLPKAVIHGSSALLSLGTNFMVQDANRDFTVLSGFPVGWAAWNMAATNLSAGIKIVLYDGVPYFLSPTYFWDIVDEFQIRLLYLPPSVLDEYEKKNYVPTEDHALLPPVTIVSGSSIVRPNNYDFVYNKIKKNILFYSRYGSTELPTSCLSMHPSLPVYRGELQSPCLGIDLLCIDESGKHTVGEIGELLISKPTPSMPLGLWDDTDGSVYKKTYFSKFQDKFGFGDLGIINPITRGTIIYGRSDETLKPGLYRFGSSEIYNVVIAFEEILDSICVSQYNPNRKERAVLFVKMKEGHSFDATLDEKLRQSIEKKLSADHVPALILETHEIPYNMNDKKVEIIVKKIINGMPYNAETVKNPGCLEFYKNTPPYVD